MRGVDPDQAFSVVPYIKGFLFLLSLERAVGRQSFDEFLRRYISAFRFQSITTEEFLAFLRRELPGVGAKVDLDAWVYRPGLAEPLPELSSKLFEQVSRKVADFSAGRLPKGEEMRKWNPYQKGLFLKMLPEKIAPADCQQIERALGLDETRALGAALRVLPLGHSQRLPGMPAGDGTLRGDGRATVLPGSILPLPGRERMVRGAWPVRSLTGCAPGTTP